MSAEPSAYARFHWAAQKSRRSRAAFHDCLRRRNGRLYAGNRTGSRADVIKTDTDGLTAGDTKIKVADGEMPGYFARPNGVNNPPVVLVAMEIFGLHEYIKDVTRPSCQARGARCRAGLLFPQRCRSRQRSRTFRSCCRS